MPHQDRHETQQDRDEIRAQAEAGQATSQERIGDGRNREPGVHPSVERTGRSRTIMIALVVALAASALMFAAIVLGIINPW